MSTTKKRPVKRSAVSLYLAEIGSKGGKAGSSDDKRKAAKARWDKERLGKPPMPPL